MKEYFATLHTKSVHHHKRFALTVSGCFTLLIFAIWTQVHFGTRSSPDAVAQSTYTDIAAAQAVSPVGSLKASAQDAWSLLTVEMNKAKAGLQSVDLQDSYTQVRDNALDQKPVGSLTNPTNQYGQ